MNDQSPTMTPWRFVVCFGAISFFADFVYESARSVTGPYLATLGASAALVGLVTGAGEAAALVLRLVSGPLADRTQRFWALTITGYAITAVTVPLLGLTSALWVACGLVIAERVGKAVRAPAKDTMLSHATSSTGRGKGFAVHQAMDQFGAFLGPLTVAVILATTDDNYHLAFGALAVPGMCAVGILVILRRRVPSAAHYELHFTEPSETQVGRRGLLPLRFWLYGAFAAVTTLGSGTFGVLSFHMVHEKVFSAPVVPVVYAFAMFANAVAALFTGWAHDRFGSLSLLVMPIASAIVPFLAFRHSSSLVIAGAIVWGMAIGVQESTLRASVAEFVPAGRRATAYGVFAGIIGAASLVGGALYGWLYDMSMMALTSTVLVFQAIAVGMFVFMQRTQSRYSPSL